MEENKEEGADTTPSGVIRHSGGFDSAGFTEQKIMTDKPFPEDAQRRTGIIVLGQSEIDRCHYEPGGSELLLNEEIHILEFPVQSSHRIIRDIVDRGLVRRGVVLVQSPYDTHVYEDATEARESFALAKHMYFSQLCQLLGARQVRIEQIQWRKASGTKTVNVEGGVQIGKVGGSGDITMKQDELEAFKSQLNLADDFEGGQVHLREAEELLRQTRLFGDPNMSGLLDMRRPEHNQLKSRTLTLNLSSETKRNLSVIGKLDIPLFIKLEADYKKVMHEQSEYSLTLTVTF